MYGDAVKAGGNVHVGQQVPGAFPPGYTGQPVYPGFPPGYCATQAPVCGPNPCPQRRLLGGNSGTVAAGGTGSVTITTQVPVVMRCWGVDRSSAPFVRFTSINTGVVNLIVGGSVIGDAALPDSTCGNVLDGLPLVPGQNLVFNFTNIGGAPVIVDVWIGAELLCL
jgi:hypothetical protein